eukprot:CAMPEP_0171376380 /NCGR_PEP_ID=MMETSP0879-20121228/18552_1 /TAXON_ID=67004 /ORGANISM="Thalassiosira weissflogii, Strain CCMP1336" /LENGTH=281 /DNA_ID=CAMNT_0011886189 /DNA_START=19 /DNA_END=860 /DNA_ORIENTATION=-
MTPSSPPSSSAPSPQVQPDSSFCAICYENFIPNNNNHYDNDASTKATRNTKPKNLDGRDVVVPPNEKDHDDETTSSPAESERRRPIQKAGAIHAIIPCCERDESSVKFCIDCISVLCSRSPLGIGKCPRCNGYIEAICTAQENDRESRGTKIIIAKKPLQCRLCQQYKAPNSFHFIGTDLRRPRGRDNHNNDNDDNNGNSVNMCTDCQRGMSNTLHYQCQRCHRIQRIPHPMYRYQNSPLEFGTTSWACHVGCGDYTFWRIVERDLEKVSRGDEGIAEKEG